MTLYFARKRLKEVKDRKALELEKLALEIKALKLSNLFTVVKLFLTLMLGLTAFLKLLELTENLIKPLFE
ncbi:MULTISPECIES: hypothetical protein [Vibrio]|uniref:hypothetical protein n=1 Tax=Vibrio TaxID=662 RepID=UPI0004DEE7B8|nr:hypothetical protein [Vibrio parahaemolyticus]HAS6026885.1 hypothetical protein [Vibrio vulnificus]HAS6035822.1 hypothetical protein [Vibrio vulnificus]HDY7429235.1 hypothetical protein [Vibrio vulnificus]HDY7489009.1 hypothetical protein [Vibrio vulnificus]HDY7951748.1 hypothetical protein [Vibrio vulnificus]